MNTRLVKRILPPLIPYITIGIGLLVFHNAWLAILGYHAGMIAIILLSKTRIPLKQSFQGKKAWIPLITALVGVGGGLLLYIVWPLLSVPNDISLYIRSIGLNEHTWPIFLAYFILVNPWIEEYYWRGYLASPTRRITVNDLLFSGVSPAGAGRAYGRGLASGSVLRAGRGSLVLAADEPAQRGLAGICCFPYSGGYIDDADDLLPRREVGCSI